MSFKEKAVFDAGNKPKGIIRIVKACQNSYRAIIWLLKNESAFKQECVLLIIAVPISFFLEISAIERITAICAILLLMLVEIINTAIEVVVDRIGLEMHPMSGLAKDLGSAAVGVSILIMLAVWIGLIFF